METLRKIIPNIKALRTNINGSSESFDNLTLFDIYNIAEQQLEIICSKYNITNFTLPKINGYNSLVIFADSDLYKYAIKICVIYKKDITLFNTIYKHVSNNDISPKIYYDHDIDYNSQNFIIKITVSEKLLLIPEFRWNLLNQMKISIITLIEKTIKLHSLGYVHNDIKYENLGLDIHGNVYLFDFDNFTEISKSSCSLKYSSSVCHPPDIIIKASISNGLGNQIIDLFSICIIILGDIIGLYSWHFDNAQYYEKNFQIIHFKRNKVHSIIQNKIHKNYENLCLSQFWFSLINFFHLVFQKNSNIKNKHAFTRRAKKLIARMKNDLQ
jgi:serine/threonine protein kinase